MFSIVSSFLKVFSHGLKLGGNDGLNLLNDFNFLLSLSGVLLIESSPFLANLFLGSLLSGLGLDGFNSLFKTFLLESELSLILLELSFSISLSLLKVSLGLFDFSHESVEVSDGLLFIDLVLLEG